MNPEVVVSEDPNSSDERRYLLGSGKGQKRSPMGKNNRRYLQEAERDEGYEGSAVASGKRPADEESLQKDSDASSSSESKASNLATMMCIFRTFVGAGILSLPFAFTLAGVALGPIGTLAVLGFLTFGCYGIIDAARRMEEEAGIQVSDLGSCLEAALNVGPDCFGETLARRARKSLNALVCVPQVVFAGPYLLFIAKNVKEVANLTWDDRIVIMMIFPLVVILGTIRSTRFLGLISSAGNVIFAIGFCIVLEGVVQDPLPIGDLPLITEPKHWPKFISLCIYTFEGIIPLLHLRARMRQPKDMLGWNGVLLTVLNLIMILYVTMGFFGYLKYGNDVSKTITLNLPRRPLYDSLRIIFSCVLVTSFPVQMIPIVEIVYRNQLSNHLPSFLRRFPLLPEMIFRFLLVVVYFVPPLVYPSIDNLMSLIGTITGVPLGLVLPSVVQLLVRHPSGDYGPKRILFFVFLFFILVSSAVCVFGIVDAVVDMIAFYED